MTTYELRNADPIALTGDIAGIVSACDAGAKITVHVSRDHGEHVAVVEIVDAELSDLARAYLGDVYDATHLAFPNNECGMTSGETIKSVWQVTWSDGPRSPSPTQGANDE